MHYDPLIPSRTALNIFVHEGSIHAFKTPTSDTLSKGWADTR